MGYSCVSLIMVSAMVRALFSNNFGFVYLLLKRTLLNDYVPKIHRFILISKFILGYLAIIIVSS